MTWLSPVSFFVDARRSPCCETPLTPADNRVCFYCSQNSRLLQSPPWPQQGPPRPHLERESANSVEWCPPPLEMMPAPPLISLFTVPPQPGQDSTSGSDIFWRSWKRLPQALHWYSYAGIKNPLPSTRFLPQLYEVDCGSMRWTGLAQLRSLLSLPLQAKAAVGWRGFAHV
jgi:hypothetical protein